MTAGIAYPADYSTTYSGPIYTANQGRTALSAAMGGATSARPLGGISGVRPGTPSTTITATSTTWTAAAFAGYIDTAATATNGGYYFSFPSGGTGSVTAAAASARIDLIYVQLSDVNTGDGTTVAPKVDVLYLAGTAGSGVPPATPARSIAIANINVPATGGGSPTVTWVAPYCVAAGGILPAALLAQLPATGYIGQLAEVNGDTTANNLTYRWNGSAWKPWNSDWIPFIPVWTQYTRGNGSLTLGIYRYENGAIHFRVMETLGSSSSMGTNPFFTIPVSSQMVSNDEVLGTLDILGASNRFGGIVRSDSGVARGFYSAVTAAPTSPNSYNLSIGVGAPMAWSSGCVLSMDFLVRGA